ncbi:VPA1269 family protein [Jiella sonneratiae]|uniref:Tyrosine-type recombinase/integrase n=1 Tax=Jiella sonneratiae TaxID=2816856 RepID=A0ABS3IZ48_9HYPH|nr:VPA1269 family protein [Jiella sonneratiae]MBO0902701.1 tyrosine-type recombinase/integrase [Jiella sonneratiae]
MQLEFRNERNVASTDDEPGVYANLLNDTVVILRMPSRLELLRLWGEFEASALDLLGELWSMTNGEITDRWGNLGFVDGFDRDEPFGFRKINRNPPRFAFLKEQAVVEALVDIGAVGGRTALGRNRQSLRNAQGSLSSIISGLSKVDQRRVIRTITQNNGDLELVLKTRGYTRMATSTIYDIFGAHCEPADMLEALAEATEASLLATAKPTTLETAQGKDRIAYAPIWFSHYLVSRGMWVWPIGFAKHLRAGYPMSLWPFCVLHAVPKHAHELAGRVISLSASGRRTSSEAAARAFLYTTFASNAWCEPRFAPSCLAAMKGWMMMYGSSADAMSSGMNRVYELAARHFDIDFAATPLHAVFTTGRRIAKSGVDIFDWCLNPTPCNTKKAVACLGGEVTSIPPHVRDWAIYLREALPLLRVESLDIPVTTCNAWLVYLLTLSESEAPRDMSEVVRTLHVNDGARSPSPSTFVGFLTKNRAEFGENVHGRVISLLANLWNRIAKRDGFSGLHSCPFDAKMDTGKTPPSRTRTPRPAMDLNVLSIIAVENRRDGYALARSDKAGRHHFRVVEEGATKVEGVFWPVVPLIVDIILHSPARQSSVRWLDSGEGDEFLVDIDTLREIRNPSPLATRGRREGFLRLYKLGHGIEQATLGMFYNTDKIRDDHEIQFIAPHLPAAVAELIDLQRRYNPMRSPIVPKDPQTGMERLALARKRPTYPLFRLPDTRRIYPPSSSTVMSYWRVLMKHCQPLVDQHLGYHYPLLDEKGLAIFDMHSMRVTATTEMLERGENLETVQQVLGHASLGMTLRYRAVSSKHVHGAMMRLIEARKDVVERAARSEPGALAELVAEAVHVREDDCIDADRVMQYSSSQVGFLDFFAHGICVGGSCETGGKRLSAKKYGPVWRPRACGSGCRFRLSGPRFLSGLIARYNALSMEHKISGNRDREINRQIRELEDEGKPVAHLRSATRKNVEFRAAILAEMQAESELIAKCMSILQEPRDGADARTLVVAGSEASLAEIEVRLEEMHELELAHRILSDARIVTAAAIDVPPGTEAMLAAGLRRIADSAGMRGMMAGAGLDREIKLLDILGEFLFGQGAEIGQIDGLLEGRASDDQIARIGEILEGRPSRTDGSERFVS